MYNNQSEQVSLRPPFIRERDIAERYGISRPMQHRLRRQGILPEGIRIAPRTVIYCEAQVLEAIAKIAAERRTFR